MNKHHSSVNQNNIMIAGIALGAIVIAILLAVLVKSTAEEHECTKKTGFYDTSTRKCHVNTVTGEPIEINTNKIIFTNSNREIVVTGALAPSFNGTKILSTPPVSDLSEEMQSFTDLQKPLNDQSDRRRYVLEGGQVSFALDIPKSSSPFKVYRGK